MRSTLTLLLTFTLAACATPTNDGNALTASVFEDFTDDRPGCAVAVRSPDPDDDTGKSSYANAFGLADTDTGQPLSPDTIFDIGSVSKQITAGAIAVLVVEGELDLDDDITDLLGGLPDYDETITLADLIHHTSGLPDYIDGINAELDEVTTAADARQVIDDESWLPAFDPGTEFEYSNTNYFLLAEIVEATTGQTLVDYAAAEIFEPLGMTSTTYRDDQGDLLPGQAQGYDDAEGEEPTGSAWQQTGDGAVHSTVTDMLLWTDLLTGNPDSGQTLGSSQWLDVMLTPGAVPDEDGTDYGGGLELNGDGTLSHGGSWIGYSSALVMNPDEGLAVMVACNVDGLDAESLAADVTDVWAD